MKKIQFISRDDLFKKIKIGDIIEYNEDRFNIVRIIILKNNKLFLVGYSLNKKMNRVSLVVDSPICHYGVWQYEN